MGSPKTQLEFVVSHGGAVRGGYKEPSWGWVSQEGDGSDLEPPDAGEDSKSENGENAPIYCICRKPDINCFMM